MALSVIWLSVILGASLGLWQRITMRATGPIRTFAVVAATLVVGMSLLPHALESEGLWGLVAAAGGLAVIPALERLIKLTFRTVNTGGLRLEVGFLGLSVHRFGDGVVMAVDGHGHDVLWAVAAHEVPIVALVTLAYARRGLSEALIRAALLGVASSLGYWFVGVVPETRHDLHGWADALAAGILIHIVADAGFAEELQTARERTFDVLAGLLGMLLVVVPSAEHAATPGLGDHLLSQALATVPWLGAGSIASAALSAQGLRWARSSSALPAWLLALAAALGFESLVLAAHLLGWRLALAWLSGASVLGAAAVLTLGRLGARADLLHGRDAELTPAPPRFARRWWTAFQERWFWLGGWVIVGLLGASYVDAFVPPAALATRAAASSVAIGAALALASGFCAPAAIPLAASLVSKGLEPGVALAGLLLGPAANVSIEWGAKARLGWLRQWLAASSLAPLAWALGALASAALQPGARQQRADAGGAIDWLLLGALASVLAARIWRTGIRGWMAASLARPSSSARRAPPPLELHVH